jgi:large subunit ribosomal protein L25
MKTNLTLNVAPRTQTGRSASRRLRNANQVPAILYGKHTSPEKLSIDGPEFRKLLKAASGRSILIEIKSPARKDVALSIIQEISRDPITDKYLHVDLHEVKADEKFEIDVSVRVIGESFGVKNQSGVLEIGTHTLRIRCLPKDLPELIEVDVSPLKVGETIKVAELKPIAGVDFLDAKGQPVVSCVEPVAEVVTVAATPTAEESAAAAAPGAAAPAAGAAAPAAGAAAPAAGAKPAAGAAPAAGAKPAAGAAAAKAPAPAKK